MRAYLIKRLWHVVPVVLGVSFLVFYMMHLLPVDPARALLMSSQAG
ncbi:MAG: ABC transporter permease, partial [Armatimonadetes bacterium]|nr:ABC transporter permease [Armatimonadota bacterium]